MDRILIYTQARYNEYLKVFGLVALIFYGYFNWWSDAIDISSVLYSTGIYNSDRWHNFFIFVTISVLSFISVFIISYYPNYKIRLIFSLIFFISIYFEIVYVNITGDNISSSMISELWRSKSEFYFALKFYIYQFFISLAVLSPLFISTIMHSKYKVSRWTLIIPIMTLVSGTAYTLENANFLEALPANSGVPGRVIAGIMNSETADHEIRSELPQIWQSAAPDNLKIVFIVDESIRGDYLEINGYPSNNTPFLRSRSDLINFGTMISYANCSSASRMSIRSMARLEQYPDLQKNVLRQPSMWQYAKRAGFDTIYVDAWLQIRQRHSYLTTNELKSVDRRVPVNLTPFETADARVANEIVDIVRKTKGNAFIFVEKIGLHGPYRDNYPKSYRNKTIYTPRPSLNDRQNSNVQDYLDGVKYTVDEFFNLLIPNVDLNNTIILYTSDHGQSMYDGGYEASHCSRKNVATGEAIVPFLVFAPGGEYRDQLISSTRRNQNMTMHEDIMPLLLRYMGFDEKLITQEFGEGLLGNLKNRPRKFFVLSPFTKSMQWNYIEKDHENTELQN